MDHQQMTTNEEVRMLLHMLEQSMSATEPMRRAAEKKLEEIQQQNLSAKFVEMLCQHVLVSSVKNSVPQVGNSVRLMACLWLKHFVKRHWKQHMRLWALADISQLKNQLLFAVLYEPDATIALHLSLTIAIIARGEFPNAWTYEQLFSPFLQVLHLLSTDPVPKQQKRSCDVIYRLVKELSTRRLMVHRKQFATLSVDLLPIVLQHWCFTAQKVTTNHCNSDSFNLTVYLSLLLTTTKLLSAMFVTAFRDLILLQNGKVVQHALEQFYIQLDQLLQVHILWLAKTKQDQNQIDLLSKVCYRISRLIVGIQKEYPVEFRSYLTPFLNLYWNILIAPEAQTNSSCPVDYAVLPISPRVLIESLQFFSNVLSCRLYTRESLSSKCSGSSLLAKVITAQGDVALTDEMVLEANTSIHSFLDLSTETTNTRMAKLLEIIILHYMKMVSNDLNSWQEDPEGFVILNESLTAQESVRVAAEHLFLNLLQHFPQQAIAILNQLTNATAVWIQELPTNFNINRILEIDAVLLAIGLGCYDLHDCFDFEPWFLTHLVPILLNEQVGQIDGIPVLRFRVVWLISCWLAQLSSNVRVPLYDALLQAASTENIGLQLRIVQTLESMVNDWGFDRVVFRPYLPRTLDCLYGFIPQTQDTESKLKILTCVESIVHSCGSQIVVYAEQISAPIPTLWQSGGDGSNLIRSKILQLLTKVVSSIQECNEENDGAPFSTLSIEHLWTMCLQVVPLATSVQNPEEVFLMESGLDLWKAVVDLTLTMLPGTYTEELHILFENALLIIERDYEHVSIVMSLLDAYVKVGGIVFWRTYCNGIQHVLGTALGNVKAEASLQIAGAVERIVTTFPLEEIGGLIPMLQLMVRTCLAYYCKELNREPETVVVAYSNVFARLCVLHLEFFFVQIVSRDMSVLVSLLELMLGKVFTSQSLIMLRTKKLWSIALCAVLEIVEEPIMALMGQIIEVCVDVIEEELIDESSQTEEAGAMRAFIMHHRQQNKQLQQSKKDVMDNIIDLDLKFLLCNTLSTLTAKLSPARFSQLIETVDSSVLRKLNDIQNGA